MNDSHRSNGHTHLTEHNGRELDAHYLGIALGLITLFMVAEVVVAIYSGSLALIADAGHMLTDAGALATSIWATRLAMRPAVGSWTFGFKRAEILSAAGNGVLLLIVAVLITFESIHRLVQLTSVNGSAVTIVAFVGVAVNLLTAYVIAKASRTSLNVEGAYQHILTDLYGFLATAAAGIAIIVTGYERADAIASLVVVVLMLRAAWGLLKASGRILLEAAPENISLADIRAHLLEVDHVIDVHDVHAWTLTSDMPALSAHVVVEETCFLDGHAPQIIDKLQACLIEHFGVEHCTFQLEPVGHLDHEPGTH
jgi:cobalt-zinc-cadmium efflux system protein